MKKKTLSLIGASLIISMSLSLTSLAGQWVQDERGWRYQEYDGTFVHTEMINENGFETNEDGSVRFTSKKVVPYYMLTYYIDGNSDGIAELYPFDLEGYLMTDTTIKDARYQEFRVNSDGAVLDKNGKIITKSIPQGTVNPDIFKGILYPKYVNILMNGIDSVDANWGTTVEDRKYYESLSVGIYDERDSRLPIGASLLDNKVVSVGGYGKLLFTNPNISVSEIDALLGVNGEYRAVEGLLSGHGSMFYTWTLQENPKVVMEIKNPFNNELRHVSIDVYP